ncbi:hypothetical protein LXA43DRAFT_1047830 [Ganoderma leucocontextum]|nr:hypothetical protein LXA43DRAFT_1047830 [Ganoderma leucocontextum]
MTNDTTGSTTSRKAQQSGKLRATGEHTQEPEPAASGGSSQQPTGKSTTSGSAPQQSSQRIEFQSGGSETLPGSSDDSTPEQQPITQRSQANLEVTRACESIIDTYKRGQQPRVTTLLSLAKALGVETADTDDDAALQAFDSYYAQVLEIDNYRKESQQPTKSREPSRHRPEAGDGERGRTQTLGEPKRKERTDRERSRSPARHTPRSRSSSLSPSEDGQPASKRQKQNPALFAWASENTDAEKALRPELQKTIEFLRNYEADIKSAKADLRNSVTVPEFPDAEWTNVLLGKPVDLNHVFSGQYTLEQDEKHVQKFGLVELSYRTATPSKIVKNAGDWIIAWQRTTAATLYAFPHRRAELDGYYLHIFSLFSAVHTSHHACILDYDRAVRKRVAAKRTLLLTDTHEFRDLHVQFIDTFGASASGKNAEEGKKRGGSAPKPRGEEACRRWNRGICDITDGTCKYIHRCTSCSSTDHPATRCSKNPKRKT